MDKIEEGSLEFISHSRRAHSEEPTLEMDRFFIVLAPEGKGSRLIELGRKRTPEIELRKASTTHHLWGVVKMIAGDRETIMRRLAEEYGDGEQLTTLAAGDYLINDHGNHSDFVYSVNIPAEAAEEARHMGIESDQELIMSVLNPEREIPPDFEMTGGKPGYPDAFADMFNGSRFIKLANTALLDYDSAAFVLMTPNPRLVHAEFKFYIDAGEEEASAAESLEYLHRKHA